MTHGYIRRFKIEGTLAEQADLIRQREQFERILDMEMRDDGWVPLLDVAPAWSTSYVSDKNHYTFLLTMQAVWVGKEKSWTVEGISDAKELPKPTPTDKLRRY